MSLQNLWTIWGNWIPDPIGRSEPFEPENFELFGLREYREWFGHAWTEEFSDSGSLNNKFGYFRNANDSNILNRFPKPYFVQKNFWKSIYFKFFLTKFPFLALNICVISGGFGNFWHFRFSKFVRTIPIRACTLEIVLKSPIFWEKNDFFLYEWPNGEKEFEAYQAPRFYLYSSFHFFPDCAYIESPFI